MPLGTVACGAAQLDVCAAVDLILLQGEQQVRHAPEVDAVGGGSHSVGGLPPRSDDLEDFEHVIERPGGPLLLIRVQEVHHRWTKRTGRAIKRALALPHAGEKVEVLRLSRSRVVGVFGQRLYTSPSRRASKVSILSRRTRHFSYLVLLGGFEERLPLLRIHDTVGIPPGAR